jgi:hypothetical protein
MQLLSAVFQHRLKLLQGPMRCLSSTSFLRRRRKRQLLLLLLAIRRTRRRALVKGAAAEDAAAVERAKTGTMERKRGLKVLLPLQGPEKTTKRPSHKLTALRSLTRSAKEGPAIGAAVEAVTTRQATSR